MAISFMRIDDRIIHGQIIIRWSTEFPCDGILAVNDDAAANPVVRAALKAASTKKTLIYSYSQFLEKMEQAVNSEKNYFLITKEPATMAKILEDNRFKALKKLVNVGPQSAKSGTVSINKNADITKADMEAYERIHRAGYQIEFQLVPDLAKVEWSSVREKLLNG